MQLTKTTIFIMFTATDTKHCMITLNNPVDLTLTTMSANICNIERRNKRKGKDLEKSMNENCSL